MSSQPHTMPPWVVRQTRLPLLSVRCVDCRSESATTGEGRFRVNANGKLLDVWLLVRCVLCDRTRKLTVRERAPVRSFDPSELDGYHASDPELVASTLLDPLFARRNHVTLDWTGAWRLDNSSEWLDQDARSWSRSYSTIRCRYAQSDSWRRGLASAGAKCYAGSSAISRCAVRRAPGSPLP
jgi:hypothetical protein